MTEREAIGSTYFDTASIYRRTQVKDETIKQTRQSELLAVEKLSCALSQNKSGTLSTSDGYGKTSSSYTLFCAPNAPVLTGDKLVITTLSGQVFTLWAGKGFSYPSHMEVPLSSEEERA